MRSTCPESKGITAQILAVLADTWAKALRGKFWLPTLTSIALRDEGSSLPILMVWICCLKFWTISSYFSSYLLRSISDMLPPNYYFTLSFSFFLSLFCCSFLDILANEYWIVGVNINCLVAREGCVIVLKLTTLRKVRIIVIEIIEINTD